MYAVDSWRWSAAEDWKVEVDQLAAGLVGGASGGGELLAGLRDSEAQVCRRSAPAIHLGLGQPVLHILDHLKEAAGRIRVNLEHGALQTGFSELWPSCVQGLPRRAAWLYALR